MSSEDPVGLPSTVGPYELIEFIGEGDIGRVYAARKLGVAGFDKRLVVKSLRRELSDTPKFRDAFLAEARLAVSLSHTNIVQVVEIGEHEGLPFIVMEHVQGLDLAKCNGLMRARQMTWSPELAAFVAAEVAMGLDHAHRRRDLGGRPLGIVHQDISPSNVLLSYEGAVKITDFGVASTTGEERPARVTNPRYLAPEQIRKDLVDPRTDVYGCGLLLLEMATGRAPFSWLETEAATEQIGRGALPLLDDKVKSWVDPSLHEVLAKATAPWPDDRFEDAAELYEALMSIVFAAPKQPGRRDVVEILSELRESVEATEVVPAAEVERALGSWRIGDSLQYEAEKADAVEPEQSDSQDRSYEQLAGEETRTAVGSSSVVLSNPPQTPMRGRLVERREIAEAIALAAHGQRAIVEVVAPEGMGKTRLILEVIGKARSGNAPLDFYAVGCRDLPAIGRFTAARKLLRSIVGLTDEDDQTQTAITRRLRELGLSRYEREALQDVIGIGPGAAPPGPGRARATGRGLSRVLKTLSEEILTIIFFDDADLMDSDSARLLPRIARHTEGARLVIILARRDELSPWPEPIATNTVDVQPLRPEHMALVVRDIFGASSVDPRVLEAIVRFSDGNLRKAGELARLLGELGTVVVEDGLAHLPTGASLPSLTMNEIIDRRLDLRTELERAVLEVAACVGIQFELELITSTTSLASDVIASVLEEAIAARFILVRSPTSCAFTHGKIRDRVLATLAQEDLEEIHGRLAEAMAANQHRRDASWRLRCANHLRLAGDRARARDLLATSAASLKATGATDAAIDHFSAALELTKGEDEVPVALTLALRTADLALQCGRIREGLRASTLAIDLARSVRAHAEEIKALLLAGRLEGAFGRIEDASGRFRAALAVAEQRGDNESKRRIRGAMGELLVQTGDYRRAVAHLEEAVGEQPASKSPRFLLLAAMCRGRAGEQELSRNMLSRVAKVCEVEQDATLAAGLFMAKAALDSGAGEIDEAIGALQECRDLARAHGLHHDNALASHYLGCALLRRDRPQRAFASLRYSYELSREHGFDRLLRVTLVALLTLDVIHHRRAEPIERIKTSLSEAREAGFLSDVLEIRYQLGQALLAVGRDDEGREQLEQARRAGRATGNLVYDAHLEELLAKRD